MLQLQDTPIVYITRDIERAAGIPFDTDGYIVITNESEETRALVSQYPNTLLTIQEPTTLDTHELLEHPRTIEWMHAHPNARVLVFKNSKKIERTCEAHGWKLLNPSADLANRIEEKLSQLEWLEEMTGLLPPHRVAPCADITPADLPCVVQFNHGHTGTGTLFVQTVDELATLQHTFPHRPARISQYIDGMMCTLNAVVTTDAVHTSTISYQITGIPPFTDNPFATIGNDWVFPKKILSKEQTQQIHDITRQVGGKMQQNGWRGLFGIDVMVEKRTGRVYLIEINARQPASSTYESLLQNTLHPTTMEAHLLALLGRSIPRIAPILSGAQLFDRRTNPPIVHRFPSGIMADHGILSAEVKKYL